MKDISKLKQSVLCLIDDMFSTDEEKIELIRYMVDTLDNVKSLATVKVYVDQQQWELEE